ncbi:MAG: CAAX prenyl protease-related protein [Planctomycetia bacterium]|nr:CAAX prenyl protease-related protein [Planctomycetia bacterium]
MTAPTGPRSLAARYPWLPYVLPLVVFLVVTTLEPAPPDPTNQTVESTGWFGFALPYSTYPLLYTAKIVLVVVAMVFAMPVYRQFPMRVSPLSVVVGVVGVVAWIGLCKLGIEQRLLPKLGLESFIESGQRSGFNPLVELAGRPLVAYGFLAIRFVGLVLVVPVIEEFFLRGFLMRFCVHEQFWNVPFGTVNRAAVLAGTLLPMAMHPAELMAAGVWFSLVTLLMVRTRNIWDCVTAHAVTNLLLGIYVVGWNQWQLM